MSETPISPLRARMIEDMSVRKFGDKTQNDYSRHLRVSQHSSAGRRLRRQAKTCAAIRCIKAGPECNRQPSIARSLHCGSSSG
jgi:hypothetical protein